MILQTSFKTICSLSLSTWQKYFHKPNDRKQERREEIAGVRGRKIVEAFLAHFSPVARWKLFNYNLSLFMEASRVEKTIISIRNGGINFSAVYNLQRCSLIMKIFNDRFKLQKRNEKKYYGRLLY